MSDNQEQKTAHREAEDLALEPDLLLLDEPFSALDYQTRLSVCDDISSIIRSRKKTAILITHDLSEAVSTADRILVLTDDGIVEEGNHDQLMEQKGIYYQFYETANALK